MQHHAVVFESETTFELGVRRHFFLVDFAVFEDLRDLFLKVVGFFDVAFVKLEMHLQCLVGDPFQSAQVEFFGFIHYASSSAPRICS